MTEFVNVKGVADHFKVSERLIRTWVGQGKIPKDTYVHIQQTYRFNLAAVEAALLADEGGEGPWSVTAVTTSNPDTIEKLSSLGAYDGEDRISEVRVLTEDNIGTWGDVAPDSDADL
jgi:hypothetical protein|tara:strand:+ start:1937 stop:2287 length:351 start_codon:yes stop_codon:yes gene_type:complete